MMLHRHMSEMSKPEEKPAPEPVRTTRRKRRGKPEKIAVSVGTRNLYGDLQVMCKSLFMRSDVDQVYLFIEDDEFPLEMPEEVTTINVRNQTFFPPNGANSNTHWSYMALMKTALTKLLPDVSKALMLDYDTIIVDDISALWNTDLEGCYWAGVPDKGVHRRPEEPKYFNAGVVLMDYDLIRDNGIDDMMIEDLNKVHSPYIDQDVLNKFCTGRVKEIPVRYNESCVTGRTEDPAIVHYVGVHKARGGINEERRHFYEEAKATPWEEVAKVRMGRYGKNLTLPQ